MLQVERDQQKEIKPLKVVFHGPPASGKTNLAKEMCRRYGPHYVSVKTMIDETLQELREKIAKETAKLYEREKTKQREKYKPKEPTDDEDEDTALEGESDEEEETQAVIEDLQEQIKYLTNTIQNSANNRLPDDIVIRLMKVFLAKDICQTRGYVLDGYPKTYYQTKELFGQVAEINQEEVPLGPIPGEADLNEEGQQIGNLIGNAPVSIMPDYIISLDASDDFLCQRVMKLPQKLIKGTHYDEVNMMRRLNEFNFNNSQDQTCLTFFDEAGIHPIVIKIYNEANEEPLDLNFLFNYLYDIFGEPIPGLGISAEEEEHIKKLELEQLKQLEEGERLERELIERKARKEYEDKMERWIETLEKLQIEEEKLIAAQSEPLRFYLMKYIFPTLTKALIEVAKVKPEDPIDFLAEYLFKENPEGKMFDPSYTLQGEKILQQYEEELKHIVDESQVLENHYSPMF